MGAEILNLNIVDVLKKRINELEEHCKSDIYHLFSKDSFVMISVLNNDIALNFDVQCELDDSEKEDLIEKIEDYANPTFEISSDPISISEIKTSSII